MRSYLYELRLKSKNGRMELGFNWFHDAKKDEYSKYTGVFDVTLRHLLQWLLLDNLLGLRDIVRFLREFGVVFYIGMAFIIFHSKIALSAHDAGVATNALFVDIKSTRNIFFFVCHFCWPSNPTLFLSSVGNLMRRLFVSYYKAHHTLTSPCHRTCI